MRTFVSLIRRFLRDDRRGASALEFGLIVPVLMLAVGGVTELGGYFQQSGAVEKGLRSAATYAARADLPLSSAALATIEKIARTGETNGSIDVVEGWSDGKAKLTVTVSDVTSGGTTVSVIRLEASLPYTPVVPVIDGLEALRALTISATHEQAHIGG
ncbi:MAG: pilus assembly protein [Alphaproteobacteria bacterium]